MTSYNGKTKAIFVPGDNDIGGEDGDRVTKEKVERFQKHFPSKSVNTFSEKSILQIIPVNALTQGAKSAIESGFTGFPTKLEKEDEDKPLFRMLVTHLPIMPMQQTLFVQQVLELLNPSIIFSAHDHSGANIIARQLKEGSYDTNMTAFTQKTLKVFDENPKEQPGKDDFYVIPLYSHRDNHQNGNQNKGPKSHKHSDDSSSNNILHEVVVPTCSYRMGVKEMAFGISAINLNSVMDTEKDIKIELAYANLWLPSRFALLFVYVAALVSSAAIFILGWIQSFTRGRREHPGSWRSKRRSSSNSPSPRRRSSSRNKYYSKLV